MRSNCSCSTSARALLPAGGRDDVVRVARQPPRQKIAVRFVIVDDENSVRLRLVADDPIGRGDGRFAVRVASRGASGSDTTAATAADSTPSPAGEFDETVDAGEQPLRRVQHLLEVVDEDVRRGFLGILEQHFAIALEGGDGRPQVVTQLALEVVIAGICRFARP